MSALYYYVCNECGNIVDIAAAAHADGENWICDQCEDDGLTGHTFSVFTDEESALRHVTYTSDMRFAVQMAELDQAKARADRMRGKS